MKDFCVQIWWL